VKKPATGMPRLRGASSSAFAHKMGRQRRAALKRLEVQVQSARASFISNPTRITVLGDWQRAVQELQDFHSVQAERAATRAGVLWQQYGEQSTSYFHHLSQQRKRATTLTGVLDRHDTGEVADLRTSPGRKQGGGNSGIILFV
jgi:hypothetical protein